MIPTWSSGHFLSLTSRLCLVSVASKTRRPRAPGAEVLVVPGWKHSGCFGKAEAQGLNTGASIILCVSHLSQGAVTEGPGSRSWSQLPVRRGQGSRQRPVVGLGLHPKAPLQALSILTVWPRRKGFWIAVFPTLNMELALPLGWRLSCTPEPLIPQQDRLLTRRTLVRGTVTNLPQEPRMPHQK